MGDHGAALESARLDSVARYLVTGQPQAPATSARKADPMWGAWAVLVGSALGVVGGFGALGYGLVLLGGLGALVLGGIGAIAAVAVVMIMLNL